MAVSPAWPCTSCSSVERGPLGRLTAIVICEQLRRRGIGGRLVAEVERRAREEGCERLELTTAARRIGAHAFYGHLGFTEHSRRFIKPI
jgi:GNAT superfamily N-acetyltransferase